MKSLHFYIGLIIFLTTVIYGAGKLEAKVTGNQCDIEELRVLYKDISITMNSIDKKLANIEGKLYYIQKKVN